jgi:hypothetical protein
MLLHKAHVPVTRLLILVLRNLGVTVAEISTSPAGTLLVLLSIVLTDVRNIACSRPKVPAVVLQLTHH